MAKTPYLVRRKNVFYFRLSVPVTLRDSLNVREFFQSLRTENREEASYRALTLVAYFKADLHNSKTNSVNTLTLTYTQLMAGYLTSEREVNQHTVAAQAGKPT